MLDNGRDTPPTPLSTAGDVWWALSTLLCQSDEVMNSSKQGAQLLISCCVVAARPDEQTELKQEAET